MLYWCRLVKQRHWSVWGAVGPMGCHEVMLLTRTGVTLVVVRLGPVTDAYFVLQHDKRSVELGDCESWQLVIIARLEMSNIYCKIDFAENTRASRYLNIKIMKETEKCAVCSPPPMLVLADLYVESYERRYGAQNLCFANVGTDEYLRRCKHQWTNNG
jgi:hypothetical protein